jgi:hypothetical protein
MRLPRYQVEVLQTWYLFHFDGRSTICLHYPTEHDITKTDKGCPACAAAKHKSVAIVSPMSGLNFIDEFEELRYVYKLMTLGPGKYIRLIELSSGGDDDPILCQKYYACLDDSPTYEAITYT